MILEAIVTSQDRAGAVHIAPMGIHRNEDDFIILPFKPSQTLENILATESAVLNFTDDVRVFAGCLTGRRNWPLQDAEKISGKVLRSTLTHLELILTRIEDDPLRPRLYCKAVHEFTHAPFFGFNRAQFSVLEAAILVSRLNMLAWDKIESELEYLRIGMDKTAGPRELEAWNWLMDAIEQYRGENQT